MDLLSYLVTRIPRAPKLKGAFSADTKLCKHVLVQASQTQW